MVMTIRRKLVFLIMTALLATAAVGGIGIRSIFAGQAGLAKVGLDSLPSVAYTLRLKEIMMLLSRENFVILSIELNDPLPQKLLALESAVKDKKKAAELFSKAAQDYDPFARSDFEIAHWKAAKEATLDWVRIDEATIAAAEKVLAKPSDAGFVVLHYQMKASGEKRKTILANLTTELTALADWNFAQAEKTYNEAKEAADSAWKNAVLVFLAAAIILAIYGLFIMRSVMRPIDLCRSAMHDITETSNLTQRIDYKLRDEMGEMILALNAMLEKMQSSLHKIQSDMGNASTAVSSLSQAAEDVALSASTQSNASSAMAASIEEMTASINTVSGNAGQTRLLADESEKISVEGGRVIDETASEMVKIAQSVSEASRVIASLGEASQQISAVVQVIKEVADQTNLLALNAAIEAARAGEQGRGFAVVADEVRKLAERTTSSTAEISQMIGKIQEAANGSVHEMERVVSQVGTGQALAEQAGKHMHDIRSSVQRVAAAIAEISVTLREQSSASEDITRHVEQIAQMTDQNLASAENTANSAREVDSLSQSISSVIHSFRV